MAIREQYLKELKYELSQCVLESEVIDIVSDYNGFFEAGILEGKSEQELIDKFGSPQDIAQKLKYNSGNQNVSYKMLLKRNKIFTAIAKILLIAILVISNISYIETYYVFNNNIVSLIVCTLNIILLYLIHKCFKDRKTKHTSMRKMKSLIFASYILPVVNIIAMLSMVIYTTYLATALSENGVHFFLISSKILINYTCFAIIATSILMILIAIKKNSFSPMSTGFQFVLFTFVFLLNCVLANTDIESQDGINTLYDGIVDSSIGFATIVLIFLGIYFCYKLFFNAKSVQDFLLLIFILVVHGILIFMLNLSAYRASTFILVVLESVLVFSVIAISVYTKNNKNYCFAPNISTKISLVGIITLPILSVVLMVVLNKLYFNVPNVFSLKYEYVIYVSSSVLATLISTVYIIFTVIYNVNGKAKKSYRYLSLVGLTPILSMRYFIALHDLYLSKPNSWNERYVSGMKDLKTYAIVSVIISIIIPLIMLAIDKIAITTQNKRGEDTCKLN